MKDHTVFSQSRDGIGNLWMNSPDLWHRTRDKNINLASKRCYERIVDRPVFFRIG